LKAYLSAGQFSKLVWKIGANPGCNPVKVCVDCVLGQDAKLCFGNLEHPAPPGRWHPLRSVRLKRTQA
jgi:hypothetical protein